MLLRHWQFNTLTRNLALLNLTLVLPYSLCACGNSFRFKKTMQGNFSPARTQTGEVIISSQRERWKTLPLLTHASTAQPAPVSVPLPITLRVWFENHFMLQKPSIFGGSITGIAIDDTRWRHGTCYLGQKVRIPLIVALKKEQINLFCILPLKIVILKYHR